MEEKKRRLRFIPFAVWWLRQIIISSLILGVLLFIVFNFYLVASLLSVQAFLYVFLVVSLLTDGLLIVLQSVRRKHRHQNLRFDPEKLTIIIACYNGEDVITETIEQAAKHVDPSQIIVVSDASTDKTAEVAKAAGARVLVNQWNINKAFSISGAIEHVTTPYVLVLDDDTLIGDTFIPTSLLDEGYTAVAFNVMPMPEGTILNHLQRFEYRKSMQLSKSLRSRVGAIGNVSGAIGLFHTKDLLKQVNLHSGQFGGEDEQRTLLAHLYGTGKGVVFSNSTVITKAPDRWQRLIKQRAYSWNLSTPELLILYTRVLLNPNHHYLLKSEKAYQMYIYLTDPLRILFFWALLVRPTNFFITYGFYLALSIFVWARTKFKDPWWVVVLFPPYSLLLSICRFVAHFYWLKVKFKYLFLDHHHKVVTQRKLVLEYVAILAVICLFWATALQHFNRDVRHWLRIRDNHLEDLSQQFNYEAIGPASQLAAESDSITLSVTSSDSVLSIAHRSVDKVLEQHPEIYIDPNRRQDVDATVAARMQLSTISFSNGTVSVPRYMVLEVISKYGT